MAHSEAIEKKNTLQQESYQNYTLSLDLNYPRPNFCLATVIIPSQMIKALYHEVSTSQQRYAQTNGFYRGNVPLEYIQQNFTTSIIQHLKEFLFKFCVVNFLYEQIRKQKIVVAGEPRLVDISLEPGNDAHFKFEITHFPDVIINEWKYFPFKAPKRKNYKDLDRQVELFIKEEHENIEKIQDTSLTFGDWVNFDLSIDTNDNQPLLGGFKQNFWFKLDDEEIEIPLRELFKGKKLGTTFNTVNKDLQEYFSDQLETDYNFRIDIVDVLPHAYFCLEQLKRHFRIKTNKDAHKKLIEVFSYRNDLSQRRSTVEEALKLLLNKHPFTIPPHLTSRQQKNILESVQQNPDYNVYRMQRDFQTSIRKLAEKQIKETIFIDKLAYHENIEIAPTDTKGYLNLANRPRTKEFIYFRAPSSKIHGQEIPIPSEELNRICLREKTINYAIYHWTKK
ncbi:MAG: trigger factor [bacterium]|nr:trigger factor [bacterium]